MAIDRDISCDVLVIGSGAGGLSTAITATKHGLDVVVVEKAPVFGGTTAFSGGVLWIPGNGRAKQDPRESRERAREYLKAETGNFFQDDMIEAFLDTGPEMLDWFEKETEVRFVPTLYPDYHPTEPGGVDVGRSVLAAPFDAAELGPELARLRPPLATITFIGMMFNSSNADLKHFFRATKSLTSALYVAKRLAVHASELARYRRGMQVTSGNALAARLARSCFKLGIPIHTDTPAESLMREGETGDGRGGEGCGRVGADQRAARGGAGLRRVSARRGADRAGLSARAHAAASISRRRPRTIPATASGWRRTPGRRWRSAFPRRRPGCRSRRCRTATEASARSRTCSTATSLASSASCRNGRRFCNESESYHDVGAAMIEACAGERETACWLICDAATIAQVRARLCQAGAAAAGAACAERLSQEGRRRWRSWRSEAGIDAAGLEATVAEYNRGAVQGRDDQFHRGETAFNRYLADPEHKPNPCVAPVGAGAVLRA